MDYGNGWIEEPHQTNGGWIITFTFYLLYFTLGRQEQGLVGSQQVLALDYCAFYIFHEIKHFYSIGFRMFCF